ncbi:MAG: hypothetical protein HY910_16835 [Desulfarculus sp.]|nr:hypothetical protein [Desulfarculus sp.]
MNAKDKALRGEKVRVASLVVMDAAMLERARRKAAQHGVPFPDYLERAVRLYGKLLDKKVTVIARPI